MSVSLSFDHYFRYEELTNALQDLAKAYPKLCKIESLAKSPEGRDIWAMTLTNVETGDALKKPAYYLDGNHHAGEVTGTMACMYFLYQLLTTYGSNDDVTKLLDEQTVYVIPCVSPDGMERYLSTPDILRSSPKAYPMVDYHPGIHGEDINGDGHVTMMRMKSPLGQWKVADFDSRLMVRRSPDEKEGTFYRVFLEGMVEDYDPSNLVEAEHLKMGINFNRNYPYGWFPEHREKGAGDYPLSEVETHTVANFLINHNNIGGISTMHTMGGVILYPPGTKFMKDAPKRDIQMFQTIGNMATEEMGYPIANIFEEFLPDQDNYSSGAFDDYAYEYHGIPAYTVELWDLMTRAGVKEWPHQKRTDDDNSKRFAKAYQWLDENVKDDWFAPWEAFEHPQLGEVEVGGLKYKFTYQNPPTALLEQECEKTYRFCLRQARTMPQLKIDEAGCEKISEDIYRISATVSNHGFLPTFLTQSALNQKCDTPVRYHLNFEEGVTLVCGKSTDTIGHLEGYGTPDTVFSDWGYGLINTHAGTPITKTLCWVVQGKKGESVTVAFSQPKGGYVQKAIKLA